MAEEIRRIDPQRSDAPGPIDPAPQPAAVQTAPDGSQAIIVYVLHLAGFVTGGLTTLVGLILAFVFKNDDDPVMASHYDNAIGIFWKGLVYLVPIYAGFFAFMVWWIARLAMLESAGQVDDADVLGMLGPFFGVIAFLVVASIVQAIWFVVRCAKGIAKAGSGKPYPNPHSWGF